MNKLSALFLILLTTTVSAQSFIMIRSSKYPDPPILGAGPWSYVALGSGTCTSVTDTSGTLEITAVGEDSDNGCLVYQTVSAASPGDGAQVYGRISTITGDAAATTKTGAIIANNTVNTAAHCMAWWNDVADAVRGTYLTNEGTGTNGGIDGHATSVPMHVGVSFVKATKLCKFWDYDAATTPANPATHFYQFPQPALTFPANLTDNYLVGFYVQSGSATLSTTVTITDYDISDTVTFVDNYPTPGGPTPIYLSDFESDFTGLPKEVGNPHDGWLEQSMRSACEGIANPDPRPVCDYDIPSTLDDPQRCYQLGQPNHDYALAVTGTTEGVSPRAGNYMLRLETQKLDYPIGICPGKTNERSQLRQTCNAESDPFRMESGQTYWVEFSIYLPSSATNTNYSLMLWEFKLCPIDVSGPTWFMSYQDDNTFSNNALYWPVVGKAPTSLGPISDQFGYDNKIPAIKDEWVDFRVEVKQGTSNNGRVYVWYRRPGQTSTWTKWVDYDGNFGHPNNTLAINPKAYGGGFNNSPNKIIVYHDEIRLYDTNPSP